MSLLEQPALQADRRSRRWLVALSLLLLALIILGLCAGDSWIAPSQWLSDIGQLFVWQLHLPRTLAVCGVVLGIICSAIMA
nr:Vitamin B12 import system permease protein BtuC [Candidatus Pantoea persica]